MTDKDSVFITVGIPFYNAESTLLDAVRSVFAQTHKNWELVLMDDGSTDRSLEFARSIDDPRVRVYSDGKNKRLAARLNEIARLSSFEYLARMDADDLMSPTRLERQLRVLTGMSDVDLVSSGICSLTDDYEPVGLRCVDPDHTINPRRLLVGQSGIVHASVLGRRQWFERNRYRENFGISADTNLWVRAYSRGDLKVAFVPEPLYYYREDGNVTSAKLLHAYRVGRQTILTDAGSGFSFLDRLKAYISTSGKSMVVRMLDSIGRLDLIRARRNSSELDGAEKRRFESEIGAIRSVGLPLRDGRGP